MLLIGTLAPIPAQGGMAGDLWIGVFLVVLLAIVVALHFATTPRASASPNPARSDRPAARHHGLT